MSSISIVIINHNYAEFLQAAIDSALAQTWPAAEIVLVDDGSTDGSRKIIESFGDAIVPILKAAGGHVSAVNIGYVATTGAFCIFLDADDRLYPNCIESILRILHPEDVKLQYRLDTIDRYGVDQNMPFPYFPIDLTPDMVRHQSFRHGVYPWTVSSGNAFSRRLLDALLPIDTSEVYRSPDGYLNKMAPLFGDVRTTNEILGAYRVHGKNTWAQDQTILRVEPIMRWVKFDEVLQQKFEDTAKRRGLQVMPAHLRLTLQQIEYRLLAYRFDTNELLAPRWTAGRLFIKGVRAAVIAPNVNVSGRLIWAMWFVVLAFLPRVVVRSIFDGGRAQTGRTRLSRLVVRLSRGAA